eukprot:TRINITY_DN41957_c0_g1_i1.p1 TRINITY_DN41957_c0_g1~~TRINITY_DN41957_c0_g1_i1.p1  ORF type:complete len:438 (+),score=56.45 TRINITY_DN41957_c0_g1_i1:61-1374(+)
MGGNASCPCNSREKEIGDVHTTGKVKWMSHKMNHMFLKFLRNARSINYFYIVDSKRLGIGGFGNVSRAVCRSTGSIRAVKAISKANLTRRKMASVHREIAFLEILNHPQIIKLVDTFTDNYNIFLVMEFCEGGDLFDRIGEAAPFNEAQASNVMTQIVKAVRYLHARSICHRDLKPENFMLVAKEPIERARLKLIDFGLSRKCAAGDKLTSIAGSYYYMAPEVFKGSYGLPADVWSFGVILYILLCGYPPFGGSTDRDIRTAVLTQKLCFPSAGWDTVSAQAKNFIEEILQFESHNRPTASAVYQDAWLRSASRSQCRGTLQSSLADVESDVEFPATPKSEADVESDDEFPATPKSERAGDMWNFFDGVGMSRERMSREWMGSARTLSIAATASLTALAEGTWWPHQRNGFVWQVAGFFRHETDPADIDESVCSSST